MKLSDPFAAGGEAIGPAGVVISANPIQSMPSALPGPEAGEMRSSSRGHSRLHESTSDGDAALPECINVNRDSADRAAHRRSLMLDDGCLLTKAVEHRRHDHLRVLLYTFFCVITAGTVAIIFYWPFCRRRKENALSSICSAEDAEFVIVEGTDGSYEVCPIEETSETPLELQPYWDAQRTARNRPAASIPLPRRMYVYRHTRYRYRPSVRAFVQVECEEVRPCEDPLTTGLDSTQAYQRLVLLGKNVIDVPIPPIPILLVREVLHPFVIFQVWAVIVWLTEAYWSFSIFILCTALLTAGLNLRDVLRNLTDIRNLSRYVTQVTVLRDGGKRAVIPSDQLVSGDVVVVPRSMKLPADMVLVQGQATVTEAMLTGEATVVIKTAAIPSASSTDGFAGAIGRADMRNTLFCGTQVVELRVPKGQDVLAVVVRTGYETVKGRLVLSILYPKSSHFKFMDEAIRFVGILFACAMVGFVINAYALAVFNGAGAGKVIQRGADLVTIVVPPALPLAVTVGTLYALMALRKERIFCISPPKVNLAGKINCFVFDKTGTLTTEGLEVSTIRQASASQVASLPTLHVDSTAVAASLSAFQPRFLPDSDRPAELSMHYLALLATCHSLTHVNGELAGDPLELKTFAFTRARLEEPHTSDGEEVALATSHPSQSSTSIASAAAALHGPVSRTVPSDVMSRVFIPSASSLVAPLPVPDASSAASTGRSSDIGIFRPTAGATGGSVREEFAGTARQGSSAPQAVDVLIQFAFVPALQRMGVLVQPVVAEGQGESGAPVLSYVKGSPEMLHTLCLPHTLPAGYWETLEGYARQGLRVLGCGYRVLPASVAEVAKSASRDTAQAEQLRKDVESGLNFLGFIVLENRLKQETAPTLARLRHEAGILLHMATGDNGVSAIAIGRQCGMVEPGSRVFLADVANRSSGSDGSSDKRLTWTDVDDASNMLDPVSLLPYRPIQPPTVAQEPTPADLITRRGAVSSTSSGQMYRLSMTGRAFELLKAQVEAGVMPARTLDKAVINTAIFARMSPENKASLVEHLQSLGLYVGMIGDGANDSMALRAAHVGISLSQVEASVAAPFTYAVPNPSIDAIPRVLAEGRGALATSFCLFQFMALYSTIQFATAVMIAFSGSFLSNNMYLWQDLFVVFILSFSLGQTPSSKTLTHKRPSGRLGSVHNLTITFGFIVLTFLLQLAVYGAVRTQSWFGTTAYPTAMDPAEDAEGTNSAIPETTSLFLMANFQYLACAAIFSSGRPWKQSPLTNKVFCGWMLVVAISTVGLVLGPTDGIYAWLSLQKLPADWHWQLFAASLVAFASYFAFMWVVRRAKVAGVFSRIEKRLAAARAPSGSQATFATSSSSSTLRDSKSGVQVKMHKVLRQEWKQQFASSAVADGMGISSASLGFPASMIATTHGQHGTGQPGMRMVRPDSAEWNTKSSMVDPTTPLPIHGGARSR